MKHKPFSAQILLSAMVWMLAISALMLPHHSSAQSAKTNKLNSANPAKGAAKSTKVVQPSMSNAKPKPVRESVGASNARNQVKTMDKTPAVSSKPTPEQIKMAQKEQAIAKEKAAKNLSPEMTTSNRASAAQIKLAPTGKSQQNASPNVAADWSRKREVTKKHFLSQGMSEADAERKLQEMDKQYSAKNK